MSAAITVRTCKDFVQGHTLVRRHPEDIVVLDSWVYGPLHLLAQIVDKTRWPNRTINRGAYLVSDMNHEATVIRLLGIFPDAQRVVADPPPEDDMDLDREIEYAFSEVVDSVRGGGAAKT